MTPPRLRCVTHRHKYPTRVGDSDEIPRHGPGVKGYDIGLAWCSVVHEEWHDRTELDTTECGWEEP
jgi:hypothetical protein